MKYSLFIALSFCLFLFSCGSSDTAETTAAPDQEQTTATPEEKPTPEKSSPSGASAQETQLNMEQVELQNKMRGYAGNIASVAPISADQIKGLMPDKLGGLFIYENEGETNAALGAPATFVVTIYRENYNIIKIAVTDTGGAPATILATAQWSNQNLDRNLPNGFDRTTTFEGRPAHEQFNNQTKVGVFEYIIDHRFVVSCQGKNLTIDQMRAMMKELNLDRLKNLVKPS